MSPRVPCYKLNACFDRPDVVKRLLANGRSGFYFSVDRPGYVKPGDEVSVLSRSAGDLDVATVNRLYRGEGSGDDVERVMRSEALPEDWKAYFGKRFVSIVS